MQDSLYPHVRFGPKSCSGTSSTGRAQTKGKELEEVLTIPERLSELTREILRFREERNWGQFHNPKDMAISLSLEVGELLEFMQWKNGEELLQELILHSKDVGEELSDILYWTLLIAHDLNINLADAFRAKMGINEAKYPIEQSHGSSKKYTELHPDPQSHQGGTT